MTTTDLIARLASDDAMDAPLFREVVRACGVELDPDDDRLARLMEMILVGAWRGACAALQAVVLPGHTKTVYTFGDGECRLFLRNPTTAHEFYSTHPASECRAHLIAILRAREVQGHG